MQCWHRRSMGQITVNLGKVGTVSLAPPRGQTPSLHLIQRYLNRLFVVSFKMSLCCLEFWSFKKYSYELKGDFGVTGGADFSFAIV